MFVFVLIWLIRWIVGFGGCIFFVVFLCRGSYVCDVITLFYVLYICFFRGFSLFRFFQYLYKVIILNLTGVL